MRGEAFRVCGVVGICDVKRAVIEMGSTALGVLCFLGIGFEYCRKIEMTNENRLLLISVSKNFWHQCHKEKNESGIASYLYHD